MLFHLTVTAVLAAVGCSESARVNITSTTNDSTYAGALPSPGAADRILLDLRQSLQQSTTIDQAFALFGTVDHTPYRGSTINESGWSFTTNADGRGLHALRADWSVSSADQGIRVIHYLPDPNPSELFVQWKGRMGKYASDPDANGANDSYAFWPKANGCKRALFDRPDNLNRVDYTFSRNNPEMAKVEMGQYNYAYYAGDQIWTPNSEAGASPFTTTVHVKTASGPTTTDGVMQMWINGTLVIDRHDLPGTNEPFDRWSFPETCVLVPQPQSEYFWDILVWAH